MILFSIFFINKEGSLQESVNFIRSIELNCRSCDSTWAKPSGLFFGFIDFIILHLQRLCKRTTFSQPQIGLYLTFILLCSSTVRIPQEEFAKEQVFDQLSSGTG